MYIITLEIEGRTFNGTEVIHYTGGVASSEEHWENKMFENDSFMTNWLDFYHMMSSLGHYPFLIDKVRMETPWGTRYVDRSVMIHPNLHPNFDDDPMLRVVYGGSDPLINYREDVITENWRASYLLTDLDLQEIEIVDMRRSYRAFHIAFPDRYLGQTWTLNGDFDLMMVDESWYTVTTQNYAYYHLSEDNIREMFEGGTLIYYEKRSLIGNGSVEFAVDGNWYLHYTVPMGNGTHLLTMGLRAL
jgi:hypothetical protein